MFNMFDAETYSVVAFAGQRRVDKFTVDVTKTFEEAMKIANQTLETAKAFRAKNPTVQIIAHSLTEDLIMTFQSVRKEIQVHDTSDVDNQSTEVETTIEYDEEHSNDPDAIIEAPELNLSDLRKKKRLNKAYGKVGLSPNPSEI